MGTNILKGTLLREGSTASSKSDFIAMADSIPPLLTEYYNNRSVLMKNDIFKIIIVLRSLLKC